MTDPITIKLVVVRKVCRDLDIVFRIAKAKAMAPRRPFTTIILSMSQFKIHGKIVLTRKEENMLKIPTYFRLPPKIQQEGQGIDVGSPSKSNCYLK